MNDAGAPVEAPRLALIVAMDRNGLIGRADGSLPWKLPDDLAHFKRTTMGKTVLMGRKTWASLGRPLPGRPNWVLSRDPQFQPEGARTFRSLAAVLDEHREGELMVIGGADLYAQVLDRACTLHLTEVQARVEPSLPGDVHFPAFDRDAFREEGSQSHPADARHPYAYRVVTLARR